MPSKPKISDAHPEYTEHVDQWRRCRDALSGADAVKKGGEKYLPKLPGQDTDEYKAYKARALWYNASARTREGLTGLVFATAPVIEVPSGVEPILEDVNLKGKPFEDFAEDALEETIGIGRFGIFVDHPPAVEGVSRGDAQVMGLRPYVVPYVAETIINWQFSRINNRYTLSQVVLDMGLDENDKRYFKELVLDVSTDGPGSASVYRVRIWKLPESDSSGKASSDYVVVDEQTPIKNGQPLDVIPFWFVGPEYGDTECDKSPILDLVDVNISHFKTAADLEHALFHCGLPTPVFAGFQFKEGEVVKLGGTGGLVSADPQAKAYYLEFSGAGTGSLEKALDRKEGMMAKLGARMLAEDKKHAEAAETLKIRSSGESSSLASVANSVSATLTKVLQFLCEWAGLDGASALIRLSTDYSAAGMTAPDVAALVQAFQAGALPLRDLVQRFKDDGIIAEDRSVDDVLAELPEPGFDLTDNTEELDPAKDVKP